jgi:MFS family permease
MKLQTISGFAARRQGAGRESLTIGSGYFWFYAGIGAFTPYAALYYQDLGFSGLQLGVLTALPALGASLTGPFWGIVADSLAAHRAIMRIVLMIAMVVTLFLTRITSFAPFFVTLGIIALVMVPVASLWDSYAVSAHERGGSPYGTLRIFGSLGFTVMVLVMGAVMSGGLSNRFIYAYAFCHLLTWTATLFLPNLAERRPRKFLDGLNAVRAQKSYLLLLAVAYLIASGVAMINMFLGIHIRDLGSGTEVVGTAFAVSALSELPVIGFGTWIMMRIGARRMVVAGLAAYILRFSLLAAAPTAEWVIFAQIFHGISFGMFLVASVNLAHRLVGAENAATAQALLGTMSFGFGNITGSLIGGALLDVVGTRAIFTGVVGLMVVALAVFMIGGRLIATDDYEPQRQQPASG